MRILKFVVSKCLQTQTPKVVRFFNLKINILFEIVAGKKLGHEVSAFFSQIIYHPLECVNKCEDEFHPTGCTINTAFEWDSYLLHPLIRFLCSFLQFVGNLYIIWVFSVVKRNDATLGTWGVSSASCKWFSRNLIKQEAISRASLLASFSSRF